MLAFVLERAETAVQDVLEAVPVGVQTTVMADAEAVVPLAAVVGAAQLAEALAPAVTHLVQEDAKGVPVVDKRVMSIAEEARLAEAAQHQTAVVLVLLRAQKDALHLVPIHVKETVIQRVHPLAIAGVVIAQVVAPEAVLADVMGRV